MFEQQYTELALAVDLVAERIRALGFPAPGTYRDYGRLSSIKEVDGVPSADGMIAGRSCAPRARSSRPWRRRTTSRPRTF